MLPQNQDDKEEANGSSINLNIDVDKMDENDLQVLREAKQAHDLGESVVTTLHDPLKYQPYIQSLMQSLAKRESVLGRYNYVTAQSYDAMGKVYSQMEEPRAVVMYRTCYRIHTFLYGKCNGHISGKFKDSLAKRGLTVAEIEEVRAEVMQSTRLEMEGDLLRRFGDRRGAVLEYQKAVRLEELTFGRDNADLAFIWRKLACLASIKKNLLFSVDFEEADRLGNKWLKQHSKVSPSICASIRRGDRYYESLLYSHAVGEYSKATTLQHTESHRGKSKGKNKGPRTPSTKKTNTSSRPSADLTRELHMLLAGEIQSSSKTQLPDNATEKNKSQHQAKASPKISVKQAIQQPSATTNAPLEPDNKFETQPSEQHQEVQYKAPQYTISSVKDVGESSEQSSYIMGKVDRMIHQLNQEKVQRQQTEEASKLQIVVSPATDVFDDSVVSHSTTSTKPPVVPTKFRKKSKAAAFHQHSSESSGGLSNHSIDSLVSTKKYLSKIASKTTKLAKRQLKRTRSAEGKPKSASSFFGSQRRNRSIPVVVSAAAGDQEPNDEQKEKPKSTSYLMLGSPPATPLTMRGGNNEVENFLTRAIDTESLASTDLLQLEEESSLQSPNKNLTSNTNDHQSIMDDSIAYSDWAPPLMGDVSNPNIEINATQTIKGPPPSTSNQKVQADASLNEGLGNFLDSINNDQSPSRTPIQSDLQSVMTSDESIKQRFLDESAQLVSTMDETEPSLVELVAHVQTMSGLLQRQTFRLQHTLEDPMSPHPSTSDKHMKRRLQLTKKVAATRDTQELCQQVEQLFENCNETLTKAFSKLDKEGDASSKHHNSSQAMEEYRETFTLEKVFLEDLRTKVSTLLASQSAVLSITLDTNNDNKNGSLNEDDEDGLWHRSEDTSSTFGQHLYESETTFQDDGMLSIVFEDNHSTPSSSRPKSAVSMSSSSSVLKATRDDT